ncbi:C40 family peptidase [Labedella endophytica]|uniref:C40 family peptidase n=1 Tax=Labedella endophytica TaxID=1523160 RepID=UPI001AA07641|nr:C40 family peptidase [Labedella endophytica]
MTSADIRRSATPADVSIHTSRAARREAERRFVAASRARKARARVIGTAIVVGLFSTTALPAFATEPGPEPTPASQTAAIETQSLTVNGDIALAGASAGAYSATTPEELAAAEAAAEAEAAARAAAAANASATSAGTTSAPPSTGSVPTTSFSLDAVFQTALQYRGTPYVFGGSTPSGFDCSGFVMYVYAQFGIDLAHSVSAQAAAGTRIPLSEAQPGDLVIMNGHDGFYAGNGMILDAPRPGKVVQMRSIWTSDYYIVRING